MEWIFYPIDSSVRRDEFDCGFPKLNEYLQKYAKQNDAKGVAKTFVAIPESGEKVVVGYYSLSMDKIEFESLPEQYRRGLPRYPLPALLIGKLAVDRSMQGRGLGEELIMQCFRKAVRLSAEVGIFAVKVDASNERAKEFYVKYGFVPLEDKPLSLFIPMGTISKLVE